MSRSTVPFAIHRLTSARGGGQARTLFMKSFTRILASLAIISLPHVSLLAQPATPAAPQVEAALRPNPAIIPVPRTGGATNRQSQVLQRAKDNPGPCDIAFIGDSITQGWEGNGKSVWQKYYGSRKCLNFGVGGDRTQHVLWRFENGQLDGIKPKAVVLMIGTNNTGFERDGTTPRNTPAETAEGVAAIVKHLRTKLPATKILLLAVACTWARGAAAQWQWIDKDGRKVFSDRPPPADIQEKNILKQPGGSLPARPTGPRRGPRDRNAGGGGCKVEVARGRGQAFRPAREWISGPTIAPRTPPDHEEAPSDVPALRAGR